MTTITQVIAGLTDPPDPATDTGDDYSDKAAITMTELKTMGDEINTWTGQANTVAGEVNANATTATTQASNASASALAAENSAVIAAALSNLVGEWSTLSGAKTTPLSVTHNGAYWALLENTSDVTADEPGVSGKWGRAYGLGQIFQRAVNVKFVAEDSGKIIEYTSGTFSQTFDPAATLASNWFVYVRNTGTGIITLDPDSSETIDGATTKTLNQGQTMLILCNGSAFVTISFADPAGDHSVVVTTGNGHGSTNTVIRRFTTTQSSTGTAITYADSAANGASFTINQTGIYSIEYSDVKVGGTSIHGISVNSSQLTTAIQSITAANRLAIANRDSASSNNLTTTVVRRFSAGDVVRPHTDASPDSVSAIYSYFRMVKIGV